MAAVNPNDQPFRPTKRGLKDKIRSELSKVAGDIKGLFQKVPGDKSRKFAYTGPDTESLKSGTIVSRRTKMELTEGRTPEEKAVRNKLDRKYRGARRYHSTVREYKHVFGEEAKVRGEGSEQFKSIWSDLHSMDNSYNGKKAQALVALGRRKAEWTCPVGESP